MEGMVKVHCCVDGQMNGEFSVTFEFPFHESNASGLLQGFPSDQAAIQASIIAVSVARNISNRGNGIYQLAICTPNAYLMHGKITGRSLRVKLRL